jgi:[glutamine synthetase] adenylyltransferase / [glutamine synthetase]-adenylyl-L-tyrosine phosphorylase
VSRRPSLEVRLARAGLEGARTFADLEAAGLVAEGDMADDDIELLSGAAAPADAAAVLAALATAAPDLLAQVRADPAWLTRVVAVAGASRPLGELLGRGTDAVLALADLEPVEVEATAAAVEGAVREGVDVAAQAAGIASIRRRATADIAGRDLTGALDVEGVARELADLAEAVLTGTLRAVHRALPAGPPRARIAVVGMGKLGGRELNYVSDVDVMFVHEPLEGATEDEAAQEATRGLRAPARAAQRVDDDGAGLRGRSHPAAGGSQRGAQPDRRGFAALLGALGEDVGVPGAHQGPSVAGDRRLGAALARRRRAVHVARAARP